jgi:hypothetical protein
MTDLMVAGGRVVRVRTTAGDFHPGAVALATGLGPRRGCACRSGW